MKLLIIRHAEAVSLGSQGITRDEDRPLTENGHSQAEALANVLQERGILPDVVFASSLVRAQETAMKFARLLLGGNQSPKICEYLIPGHYRARKLAEALGKEGGETVFAVGHNPDLSDFVCWLIGANDNAIELDKAAAAMIEFDQEIEKGAGHLLWYLTPLWFQKLSVENE